MELTPEDARNGWTKETLAKYVKEREEQAAAWALGAEKRNSHKLVVEDARSFNPFNWNKGK